jgi:hypothetical protein
MPQVDVPQEWVGLAHSAQDGDSEKPEHDTNDDSPPGDQGENEHRREQGGEEHQFAVATKKQVWPIRTLMDYDLPRLVHFASSA